MIPKISFQGNVHYADKNLSVLATDYVRLHDYAKKEDCDLFIYSAQQNTKGNGVYHAIETNGTKNFTGVVFNFINGYIKKTNFIETQSSIRHFDPDSIDVFQ